MDITGVKELEPIPGFFDVDCILEDPMVNPFTGNSSDSSPKSSVTHLNTELDAFEFFNDDSNLWKQNVEPKQTQTLQPPPPLLLNNHLSLSASPTGSPYFPAT